MKHTDNETKESVFLKLSKCINQIESKDALYLYGLSSKCKLNRICSITEKIVTAEFYLLVKGSKDVLSEIGHFDTVCHLLDLDELIVESEDQVYDAIHSYCRNSSLQLSPQQQQALWLRCRLHQLSDTYWEKTKSPNILTFPSHWLNLCAQQRTKNPLGDNRSSTTSSGGSKTKSDRMKNVTSHSSNETKMSGDM